MEDWETLQTQFIKESKDLILKFIQPEEIERIKDMKQGEECYGKLISLTSFKGEVYECKF